MSLSEEGEDGLATLSVCMIVKNEEHILSRCLGSIACIADEINVVDTGSTDKTIEIAKEFDARIHHFTWCDDFSKARNYAFETATMDYIMWLDADDYLTPEGQKKLAQFKSDLDKADPNKPTAYSMIYDYITGEDSVFSFRRIRVIRKDGYKYEWVGAVHEYLTVDAEIVSSDVHVITKPSRQEEGHGERNIKIYENKIKNNEELTQRDQYYYGRELFDHRCYAQCIEVLKVFLEKGGGWIEDNIGAKRYIGHCYINLGNVAMAREYYYKTFDDDRPRAEICCDLGHSFLGEDRLQQAIYWYDLATKAEVPENDWGFRENQAWTWMPHIQLCVCYYRLGEMERAEEQNNKAKFYCPHNRYVKINEEVFNRIRQEKLDQEILDQSNEGEAI